MDLSNLTNPHVAGLAPEARDVPADALPPIRIRRTTLAPAEEYARRGGEAETIPDALAALILSRKTWVEVTLRGVLLDNADTGGKRRYWHPDSVLCNQIGKGEKTRAIAVWNRLDPSCIHLMARDGRYLETLPAEFTPGAMDDEEKSRELASHRRAHARVADHLRRTHRPDADESLEIARANTAEIQRAVAILPAEAPGLSRREAAPSATARAAQAGGERVRDRVASAARHRRAADALFDRPVAQRETAPAQAGTYDPFDL